MRAKDFIINKINELIQDNPYIKCMYEYDEFDSTHFVLISPKEFYDKDNGLFSGEEKIINEFIELFPQEGILFISEEDEIELKNPIFEREGYLFKYNDLYPMINKYNFADLEIFDAFRPKPFEKKLNLSITNNETVKGFTKRISVSFNSIKESDCENNYFTRENDYSSEYNILNNDKKNGNIHINPLAA